MKIFFLCVLIFFAILGIAHLVFAFYQKLVDVQDSGGAVLILKPQSSIDPEFYIRSIVAKTKRSFGLSVNKILILTDSLSEKTKKEIRVFCKKYDYISVISEEKYKNTINQ